MTTDLAQIASVATAFVPAEAFTPAKAVKSGFYRMVPPAVIGLGLGLTVAWTILLMYGLYRVAGLAL